MKNFIIILVSLFGLGTVNAQTKSTKSKNTTSSVREQASESIKGPTKEETAKYLHGIIKNIGTSKTEYLKSVDVYTSEEEKYTGATLEGCNLIITLFWEKTAITPTGSGQSKGNKTITIPMDKIEKINKGRNFIKFSYYQGEEMIKSQAKFEEVNNAKSTKITEGYSSDFTIIGYDNEDVFNNLAKALNHLRKLCGAPEPISFD